MPQNDPNYLALGLAAVPGLAAIIWQIISYVKTRTGYKYDALDRHLFDLLKLTLDYPMLRSDKWIKTQLDKTEDDEDKLRYCSYASISLNIVETAIDKYKTDLSKTHFWPAIRMLLVRHKLYYQDNKDAYEPLASLYDKI